MPSELFKQRYDNLNAAQKMAVDAIDGPVLVVAGPGTGKTELLSARVANILLKTDTDAGSILCLTFTNKAATNMRERLFQLIGTSSRNVVVRTFHSFAADIMNQYPDYFWEGARLSVAPDAVQLEIIQDILVSLPLDNPLASTFAGSFTALGDVQQSLKLVKEAGLNPDELRETIGSNLAYLKTIEPLVCDILSSTLSIKKLSGLEVAISELPAQQVATDSLLLPLNRVMQESLSVAVAADTESGKTTQTGKWKRRWVQTVDGQKGMFAERKRNSWWLATADVYEAYREQLHQRGYYDYSDMLIEVLEQLERQPEMRADIQERYLYVLIDEFQDTNAAQLRLAHLVADHYSVNNRPNLMAVGDDDQSIFAFNGAELNNMLSFRHSYPDTKLIVLHDNYRSSQAILDTLQQIIEQADDRLARREADIQKDLVAQTKSPSVATIKQLSYPTRQHQQTAVAAAIKQRWDSGERSICVLARSHESLRQLASSLLATGVPIRYEQQSNILEHEAVKQINLMATTAVAIAGGDRSLVDSSLAELLLHPMWAISPTTLWKLAMANYSSPDWLDSLLQHADERLQAIGNWFVWLARVSQTQPLPIVLEHLIGLQQSDYLLSPFRSYYLDKRPLTSDYLETLSAVELLTNLSQEFSSQTATVADFVRFIKLSLSTKRVITDESWFMSGEQAVQLLTVHKAKGLEFETVFIIDTIETVWRPRVGGRSSPANVPLQAYGEQYDDYIRLLYVAASRAKYNLLVTNYQSDGRGNELLPTPLLSAVPLTKVNVATTESTTVLETDLRWPRLATNDERALLRDRLEHFSLSPTAFISFLDVAEAGPPSFMERHLLHIPRGRSVQGSYGTAVHAALETAQRLVNTSKLKLGTVLDRFEAALADGHLPPLEYEQYRVRGQQLFERLFSQKFLTLHKGGLSEQLLHDVALGQAVIGGKLDRIDITDGVLLISDYKTGKALSNFDTKDQTKAVKAWRHRTQLLFYALLVQRSGRFREIHDIQTQMLYVEAEQPGAISLMLSPTANELEQLELLIQTVWRHVMELNFPATDRYSTDRAGIAAFEQDLIDGTI